MYRDQNQRDFARTLRNEPSPAEKRLWHFLRAGQLRGHKFRRQARAPSAADGRGAYVVDFVCFSMKLVVELDGPQHLEPATIEHDTQRTKWLATRGYRVVRLRNQELDEDFRAVVDAIEGTLMELESLVRNPPSPTLPSEGRERIQTD